MPEIRYVIVPDDRTVVLEDPMSGGPRGFQRPFTKFVHERTADAGAFGADLDGIMLGLGVRQAFQGCKPGDVIGLTLEQWEALCTATRKPTGGYNPAVVYQLEPHLRAILDATSARPGATAPFAAAAE